MGSRARIAAAACVMATGVVIGGAGAATAAADTGSPADRSATHGTGRDAGRGNDAGAGAVGDGAPDADQKGSDDSGSRPPKDDDPGTPPREDDPGTPPREDDPGDDTPPCCDDDDEHCGPGLPADPDDDDDRDRGRDRDDDDGGPLVGRPAPGSTQGGGRPGGTDVIDVVPIDNIGGNLVDSPISVPLVVPPAAGLPVPVAAGPVAVPGVAGPGIGGGAGPRGTAQGGATAGTPPAQQAPRQPAAPARPAEPVAVGTAAGAPPVVGRIGYGDYLRTAGIAQIAALALPGLAGIVVLTAAGGLLGYRQAKAAVRLRGRATSRFMP